MKTMNLLYAAIVSSVVAGAIAAHMMSISVCFGSSCFAAGGQF